MKQMDRDDLLIRLDEHIKDMRVDIKDIKNTVFGNGKEGLCYIVNRHKIYFGLLGSAIIVIIGVIGILL